MLLCSLLFLLPPLRQYQRICLWFPPTNTGVGHLALVIPWFAPSQRFDIPWTAISRKLWVQGWNTTPSSSPRLSGNPQVSDCHGNSWCLMIGCCSMGHGCVNQFKTLSAPGRAHSFRRSTQLGAVVSSLVDYWLTTFVSQSDASLWQEATVSNPCNVVGMCVWTCICVHTFGYTTCIYFSVLYAHSFIAECVCTQITLHTSYYILTVNRYFYICTYNTYTVYKHVCMRMPPYMGQSYLVKTMTWESQSDPPKSM